MSSEFHLLMTQALGIDLLQPLTVFHLLTVLGLPPLACDFCLPLTNPKPADFALSHHLLFSSVGITFIKGVMLELVKESHVFF